MINKDKFQAYEKVRKSGKTNMMDINMVILLAERYGQKLTKEDCFKIILNYDKYEKQYKNK